MREAAEGIPMRPVTSLLLMVVFATCLGVAQIHGVAPSVTSFGFGGSQNSAPGVAASITSLGPQGFQCCAQTRISVAPNFTGFQGNFQHPAHGFPVYVPIYTPTYTPSYLVVQPEVVVSSDTANEDGEDGGGPTIFDRRGPRRRASAERAYDRGYDEGRAAEQDRLERESARQAHAARLREDLASEPRETAAKPEPESSASAPAIEPKTVLVFRDGRNEEVTNYAIVGDQLYDFTSGKRRIAISDLDIAATTKANDTRGMDFRLPVAQPGN